MARFKISQVFKVFRWTGLIPFALIVGGLWVGGYLFADAIARQLMESNLTRVQGAQVDVASADVSWQPFGLVAEGLAFTDPQEPSRNALDIRRTSFQLDGMALLTGKVVIESLSVDGMQFNTERSSPGRVITRPEPPPREEPTAAQRLAETADLPSPREALSRHGTLNVETRASEARSTRDRATEQVQSRQQDLPSVQTLEDYQTRLQALRERQFDSLNSVAEARSEVETLTRDVVRDRQNIDAFIVAIDTAQGDIQEALTALANAPGEDIADILATYNLTADGQIALTGLILGEQWAQWVADGQRWYATAEPWIDRLTERHRSRVREEPGVTGYFVLFPEANPTPRFWLKEALITASTEGGDWGGRIDHLSSNQRLIDRPATASVSSTRLDAAESAALELVWDRREDNQVDVDFTVSDWRVSGWQVDHEDLPIGLRRANTQVSIDASYRGGWQGAMNWDFGDAEFGMPADWGTGHLLRQALENVNQFQVQGGLSGSSVFPRTSWSSDLDNQVAAGVRDAVGAQVAAFEAQLREELDQRRAELEAPVREELARLDSQRQDWQAKKSTLESDVEATLVALESQLTERRRALEDRVDAERSAAEELLRREREEAERRAREEAERRAREALQGGRPFGF